MAKIFYDKDVDSSLLKDQVIGIIGYGSQGHAHALNLHDNGFKVIVGLYEGSKSWAKAEADGLEVATVSEVTQKTDLIMMLTPDHLQAKIYNQYIAPHLSKGKMILFAHGLVIHYRQIVPPSDVDIAMVAPKAPGHRMREMFVDKIGVPALVAVHQDYSKRAQKLALAYAQGIGSTQAGVLETTFRDETETDLFGEQSVLCGGVTSLIKAAFDTLVDAGYDPQLAYFECLHELKLIVDLIQQGGLGYMRYSVSDTAEYGDYTRGPLVIDDSVKENMKKVLEQIQDGSFAKEWIAENDEGRPTFNRLREENAEHPIEEVGKELRGMMSFLSDPD